MTAPTCPKCGSDDLYREEADIGIGTIYGPCGCSCGWSEWPEYDASDGPSPAQLRHPDCYVSSTGSMTKIDRISDDLARFGIPRGVVEEVFRVEVNQQ